MGGMSEIRTSSKSELKDQKFELRVFDFGLRIYYDA
jgi:hypothetical protein